MPYIQNQLLLFRNEDTIWSMISKMSNNESIFNSKEEKLQQKLLALIKIL